MTDEALSKVTGSDSAEAQAVLRAAPELREREFMRLFLTGPRGVRFNQVAAARAAGYGEESDDEVVRVIASRVLHQPRNVLRIRRVLARYDENGERALEEVSRLAFANIADYITWDSTGVQVKPSTDLDEDQTAAVVSVVEKTFGDPPVKTVEVKLADKATALNLLAKYHQLIGPAEPEDGGTVRPFTLILGHTVNVQQNGHPPTNGAATNGADGEKA